MRIPRAPPPPGIEKFLEVVADAEADGVHCGRRRQGAVRLLRGIGIDKPVEQRELGPPRARDAELVGRTAASAVAHDATWDATWKVTLSISSHVRASSPARKIGRAHV